MVKLDIAQIRYARITEVTDWIIDRFGPAGGRWRIENLQYIVFEQDKDATITILRWS